MPTYTIDIGGKKHKLSSEQPLSDDDISEYADSVAGDKPALQPKLAAPTAPGPQARLPATASEYGESLWKGLNGVGEGAVTLARGFLAAPISGAAGLAGGLYGLARGDSFDEAASGAAEVQRGLQKELAYAPRTEEGGAMNQILAYPMEKASELTGRAGKFVGEKVGAPVAGEVIGETLPEAAGALFGARSLAKMRGGMKPGAPVSQARDAIREAQDNGFMADPAKAAPGMTNTALESVGGREGIQVQLASKNVEHAGRLAKEEIGLPVGAKLDRSSIGSIRSRAEQVYDQIRSIGLTIPDTEPVFQQALRDISKKMDIVNEYAPDLSNTLGGGEVRRVQGALAQSRSVNTPRAWTPEALLDISQQLRAQASAVLDTAQSNSRAFRQSSAMKSAATAMEDLLDRSLTQWVQQQTAQGVQRLALPPADLVAKFRDARRLIAKTHDIEGVTNLVTGEVDPIKLARMLQSGDHLSGNLEIIARAASAMPEVMDIPSARAAMSASGTRLTDLGVGAATAAAATTLSNPYLLGAAVIRPAARALASSKPYQSTMARVRPGKPARQYSLAEGLKGALMESVSVQRPAPEDGEP